MKKITFLMTMTLILGVGTAFAGEANKMPYNGITIFEESPAGSPGSESSKPYYNGCTLFSNGSATFDDAVAVNGGLVQFSDCAPATSKLSKSGANSTISCDRIIGSCI